MFVCHRYNLPFVRLHFYKHSCLNILADNIYSDRGKKINRNDCKGNYLHAAPSSGTFFGGPNFFGYSFSNKNNLIVPTQFKRENQLQHLKR